MAWMRSVAVAARRALTLLALTSSAAVAQTSQPSVFTGVVTRDTLSNPVAGADVTLPGLGLTARTNERGEFRFSNIAAGTYLVSVRAIGFAPFADKIAIASGQTFDAELMLTPSVALLDTLHTTADRSTLESRSLTEFEARRKAHIAGAFISDSALRANEASKLSSLIASLAGARVIAGRGSELYLAAGHDVSNGGPAFLSRSGACIATVYIDGRLDYSIAQHHAPGEDPPNLANMLARNFAGVEFYASPTLAPVEFTNTGSSCGILVLWTRKDALTKNP